MSIAFSLLYTMLALAQIVIAITVCKAPNSKLSLPFVTGILFIISNILLAFRSYSRKTSIARWLKVKKAEQGQPKVKPPSSTSNLLKFTPLWPYFNSTRPHFHQFVKLIKKFSKQGFFDKSLFSLKIEPLLNTNAKKEGEVRDILCQMEIFKEQ